MSIERLQDDINDALSSRFPETEFLVGDIVKTRDGSKYLMVQWYSPDLLPSDDEVSQVLKSLPREGEVDWIATRPVNQEKHLWR